MSKKLGKKLTKRALQTHNKALAAVSKTKLTDSDRIDALEDAVLALSANAPEEVTAQMTKLYDNMIKLDKIDVADTPSQFKTDDTNKLKPKR